MQIHYKSLRFNKKYNRFHQHNLNSNKNINDAIDKFKITIKQEDKTISVILEFTKDSSDQRIQTPRCIVNSNYGKCINYIGGFIP